MPLALSSNTHCFCLMPSRPLSCCPFIAQVVAAALHSTNASSHTAAQVCLFYIPLWQACCCDRVRVLLSASRSSGVLSGMLSSIQHLALHHQQLCILLRLRACECCTCRLCVQTVSACADPRDRVTLSNQTLTCRKKWRVPLQKRNRCQESVFFRPQIREQQVCMQRPSV